MDLIKRFDVLRTEVLRMVNTGQKYQKGELLREKGSIENPYLNVKKTLRRSRRSSDYEFFLMRTLKGRNPAIRYHIKKR